MSDIRKGQRVVDAEMRTGTVVHIGPTGLLVRVLYDGERYPVARFAAQLSPVLTKPRRKR